MQIDGSQLNRIPDGSDAFVVPDLQRRIRSCDRLAAQRFGSSAADLVDRPIASPGNTLEVA